MAKKGELWGERVRDTGKVIEAETRKCRNGAETRAEGRTEAQREGVLRDISSSENHDPDDCQPQNWGLSHVVATWFHQFSAALFSASRNYIYPITEDILQLLCVEQQSQCNHPCLAVVSNNVMDHYNLIFFKPKYFKTIWRRNLNPVVVWKPFHWHMATGIKLSSEANPWTGVEHSSRCSSVMLLIAQGQYLWESKNVHNSKSENKSKCLQFTLNCTAGWILVYKASPGKKF